MPTISVIRETDLLTDAQVAAYVAAQNVQIRRDFAPDWGKTAKCVVGKKRGAWPLYLRDHSDIAGALGYHTIDDGVPEGYVFVADDIKHGVGWSVTASHEVLEMIGDPTANLVRPYLDGASVAFEACDPCQADSLGYEINGVKLSAFVRMAWFTGKVKPKYAKTPYDSSGTIKAPLSLAPGGYIAVYKNGQWTNHTAMTVDGEYSRAANSERTLYRMGLL